MEHQPSPQRFFASDNASPVHPRILDALRHANDGHALAYGDDYWSRRAADAMARLLDSSAETYFVYNGTGANVLAVAAAVPSYGAVVCAEQAHLNEDEGGAPEKFAGCKLLPAHSPDTGKLLPEDVRRLGAPGRVPHQSIPFMVSITQSTEVGTVYTPEEIAAVCNAAHELDLLVHIDGARIANAAVAHARSVGARDENLVEAATQSLRRMIRDSGADAVSFGATKNGVMFGEALVFLGDRIRDRAQGLLSLRKQGMQLHSKMRYIAAQFIPYIEEGIWAENAAHANAMAARLSTGLGGVGVSMSYPTQANGVFPKLPVDSIPELQEKWPFYVWNERDGTCRLMCSFDTELTEVDGIVEAVARKLSQEARS